MIGSLARTCVAVTALAAVGLHPGTPAAQYPGTPAGQQPGTPEVFARAADTLPDGWTMTASGPLGPADRDLLVKVRLAGLWEEPAGLVAQQRAVSPSVREAGRKIAGEHHTLDEQVRDVSAQLGVPLPDRPNAEQQGWLEEMAAASPAQFDQVFVSRLRVAHGKVFSVIAGVRAGTRNSAVRAFAAAANAAVLRHLTYLEGTGLVDFDALPLPPAPVVGPIPNGLNRQGGVNPLVIWLVLLAAVVAAGTTAARFVRTGKA